MRKTVNTLQGNVELPSKEQLKLLHSKLKSANGRRVLRSLFIETLHQDVAELDAVKPVFTLKEYNVVKDDVVLYSLKNIYFSYDHIPGFEYEFAKDVFNSWEHWVLLADSSSGVSTAIASWREELTIKLQAKAFSSLFKTALYEGAKGTPAARFLAERGWEAKRGRPSKDEVTRERKIAAGVDKEVQDDLNRLGLTLVKNS